MSMTRAAVEAAAICLVGAGLEAAFAGGRVRDRLNSLRWPSYSPPFWGWIAIGLIYYLICFAVWLRLLFSPPSPLRTAAMIVAATFMFANALWNLFFFRTRNLRQAFVFGLVYSGVAVGLLAVLIRVDAIAMWCLSPYLVYLLYAGFWGYRIWKMNPAA